MSYVFVMAPCKGCGGIVSFNPSTVPALVIEGKRYAICRTCFDIWNKIHRIDKGLKPIEIDPTAYEPVEESELVY